MRPWGWPIRAHMDPTLVPYGSHVGSHAAHNNNMGSQVGPRGDPYWPTWGPWTPCGAHMGPHMGFIWSSTWGPCGAHVGPIRAPYGSHVGPIWHPYAAHMGQPQGGSSGKGTNGKPHINKLKSHETSPSMITNRWTDQANGVALVCQVCVCVCVLRLLNSMARLLQVRTSPWGPGCTL